MRTTSHPCRVRYVFADGTEFKADAVGAPAALEAAGYEAGAMGVTVMVLA